jgi:serine/threonine protein phosphatase PrpC
MRFDTASLSERGPRSENEDAVGIRPLGLNRVVVAVADGLGGHFGGKIASHLAVDSFAELAVNDASLDLRNAVESIHIKIRSEQQRSPQHRSMATTLSAAIFSPGLMEFVHCGDSRIAISRGAGIKRLTRDHSEAQRLLDTGKLTREQFINYPRKNVLESALGVSGNLEIDTGVFPLTLGDRIFFTTDGFHNKILIRELYQVSHRFRSAKEAVIYLSKEMDQRGAEDNYSCACVFVVP